MFQTQLDCMFADTVMDGINTGAKDLKRIADALENITVSLAKIADNKEEKKDDNSGTV